MRLATETVSGCLGNNARHPSFHGTEAAQKIAMTENTPSAKPASPSPFFYVVPLLIVLAVGAMFWAGNDEREADASIGLEGVLLVLPSKVVRTSSCARRESDALRPASRTGAPLRPHAKRRQGCRSAHAAALRARVACGERTLKFYP